MDRLISRAKRNHVRDSIFPFPIVTEPIDKNATHAYTQARKQALRKKVKKCKSRKEEEKEEKEKDTGKREEKTP